MVERAVASLGLHTERSAPDLGADRNGLYELKGTGIKVCARFEALGTLSAYH